MELFRPAWDSKNEKRAVKAVAKIQDEAKLADYDLEENLLIDLIRMLDDILKNSESENMRTQAVDALMLLYKFSNKITTSC